MPYKIEIREEIILVQFDDETTFAENERARQEVSEINKATSYFKVLVDWQGGSFAPGVSIDDFEEFGSSFPKTSDSRSFAVAVILSKLNREVHFGIDFSNSIAKSNGLISRMFWEVEEGFGWLKRIQRPD